jgi:hypothetical protein
MHESETKCTNKTIASASLMRDIAPAELVAIEGGTPPVKLPLDPYEPWPYPLKWPYYIS